MTATLTIENPAYFDRLAEVEERHWWSLGVWRIASYWLESARRSRSGLRALDVGCGTGMTAVRLSRLSMIDEVIGLDPSYDALVHARRRHESPLILGSALDLPFEDACFDVATFFDVIQHVSEPEQALAELHRVLAPGGLLLIRSNGRGWSGDYSAYLLSELMERVSTAGFCVRRASYANMLPAIAQEIRGRLKTRVREGHPAGRGLQIALPHPMINRALTVVSQTEAFLAGWLGLKLPFGHSTLILAERLA